MSTTSTPAMAAHDEISGSRTKLKLSGLGGRHYEMQRESILCPDGPVIPSRIRGDGDCSLPPLPPSSHSLVMQP